MIGRAKLMRKLMHQCKYAFLSYLCIAFVCVCASRSSMLRCCNDRNLLDTEFEAGLPVIMCPVHKILDITFVPLPITSRIAVGVRCDEEWGQPATKLSLATEPNLAILQLSADEVCKTYWQPQLKPKNCSNFALTTELYV